MLQAIDIQSNRLVNILRKEWVQITLLTSLSIFAPMVLKSPQLLVGSVVNLVLTYSVLKLGFKKTLPSVLLPSLVAFSSSVLFGGATYFLIYFFPVIFIGNAIYILLIENLRAGFLSIVVGSVCKALLLFLFAYIFVNHFNLPRIFLSSMGYMQLVTAMIGGYVGYGISKVNI
ncbi:hypothetical protein K8R20_02475 [bacterium]|nr:hypothetical protein [bacterium]